MAEIEFEFPVKRIRGKMFEGMVIKLSPQGKLIVSKRPDMTRVRWSKAQKAHRQRFKLAVAYAKAALAEPKVRVKYVRMAKKTGQAPLGCRPVRLFPGKRFAREEIKRVIMVCCQPHVRNELEGKHVGTFLPARAARVAGRGPGCHPPFDAKIAGPGCSLPDHGHPVDLRPGYNDLSAL